MRFFPLVGALFGLPLLALAGLNDTPATVEFTAVPKKDSGLPPASTSTGEVLLMDQVILPFVSPVGEQCKITFSVGGVLESGITPMYITINQSGTSGAEIFNAAMPYVTNKLVTVMDTQFYTLQLKITPSEPTKKASSGQ